jgi:hypothetical protein
MAGHFSGLAEKKEEEQKKEMANDPVYKTITEDPEVKKIL